ncbi:MAG: chemotaxis protein CheW [Maricaulaceae bacterium]
MDDLLTEFLTETAESLDVIDTELVKFEANPNDVAILNNIFRLVHTIKGTCGFLGLPRLEAIAHAGETLLGKYRERSLTVTAEAVTLILESIDRIKSLLSHLEHEGAEPAGDDRDLIDQLEAAAEGKLEGSSAPPPPAPVALVEPDEDDIGDEAPPVEPAAVEGDENWDADLGRELRPGEVSLADLEAAFHAASGPAEIEAANQAQTASAEVKTADRAEDDDGAPMGERSEKSVANQSIRVNVDVLENLMTMVSELVLTRNQLLQMTRSMDDAEFKVPMQRLSNITAELQDGVMKTRMQPIGNAWKKLPRIVRDCSRELGKRINLVMEGQETELDRQVLELIRDPLTHMVRNSADHGLEPPEERLAKGKPDAGTIKLRAYHEGGHIIIEIGDDGAGLNTDRIKKKAIEKGVTTAAEAEHMTDAQIHRFIFAPGFSTAAKVTSLSGRGVGMDVVRTNIEQIGGTVDLVSTPGHGSTFTIKIPLTLAIISALIVGSGAQRFAIPQLSVVELVRTGANAEHKVEVINKTRVLRLRDRLLPLADLSVMLGLNAHNDADSDRASFVVVMQVGEQRFGVVVDEVFDTEEIVVKPLASALRDLSAFSGNTILGDGSVIMIVDPNGLGQTIGAKAHELDSAAAEAENAAARAADEASSMLVFRAGGTDPKAVPLSLVTRLEEIDADKIETSNDRHVTQYRGRLMPLLHASPYGEFAAEGHQPVLVFSNGRYTMGLAVDEIIDIVEEQVNVELESDTAGLLGTAVLKGRATEVVDVAHFLTQAFPEWFDRAPEQGPRPRRRLLLVDDDNFFRNVMTPLLGAAGYDVTAVESPAAAWGLREAGETFDVIVSDIEMPGEDGVAFAKRLAHDDRWQSTPRVALSGMPLEALEEAGRAGGFTDVVRKSDRASLVAALEYALKTVGVAA